MSCSRSGTTINRNRIRDHVGANTEIRKTKFKTNPNIKEPDDQDDDAGLSGEMEKLRKLLSYYVNRHRSEKRGLSGPDPKYLRFENDAEFQAARAEAEAEAPTIIETYTVHAR